MSAKNHKIKPVVIPVIILSGLLTGLFSAEAGIHSPPAHPGPARVGGVCSELFRPGGVNGLPSAGIFGVESQVGQILPGSSHAWGESVGWVDFRPEEAELKIGGNILAGWIRIENLGWVHFGDGSPENGSRYSNRHSRDYGVNNDGEGRLSGWAWSENAGWISFDGVAIDVEGNFSGAAVSQNIGRIIFQSSGQTEFLVKTDPYPWMEIGTGVGIRAGTGFPVGGETIGIYSGSVKFTVPSSAGFSLFFPGRGEEKIEADPVFSLLLKELVIDPREAGKRGFIRGPPEGTTTVSTVESRAGEMLFQGPISLAFFCA